MRTKKFSSNITNINDNLNILKSAAIYGPNNTGKTTLINCIKSIKGTLLNKEIHLDSNIFTDNNVCEEAISFIYDNKEYSYEYKFDDKETMYIYEKMYEIVKDQYNNEKEELIFLKDTINEKYECPQDEAIEQGKTLVIDELDSSLHFKITRAIISMFNNGINKNAQLIATLHDISLLDCKRMFRKEQIWFTDKDENGTDLYSLKEFSYAENGVRDTSNIQEKYQSDSYSLVLIFCDNGYENMCESWFEEFSYPQKIKVA